MTLVLFIITISTAVPGLSRFINYSGFDAQPLTHQYETEHSPQLSDLFPIYIPTYPQKISHVYTPPKNTYRGFTYQILDINGGTSQVGFITGSEANSLLQDSFEETGTLNNPVEGFKIKLNKTLAVVQGHSHTQEKIEIIPSKLHQDTVTQSGYYFQPIQVNHFQAGASYIVSPFFNTHPNFQHFGSIFRTSEHNLANDNNNIIKTRVSDISLNENLNDKNMPKIENESSETSQLSKTLETTETDDSSTSPSNEIDSKSNDSMMMTTESNIGISLPSDNSSNEENSTLSSNENMNSTNEDEEPTTINDLDDLKSSTNTTSQSENLTEEIPTTTGINE